MSSESSTAMSEEVVVSREDWMGRLTLNRPSVINALTHTMVDRLLVFLVELDTDPSGVDLIVLDGAGDRGLCAGGDIGAIYEDARGQRVTSPEFWRREYRLNALIAELRTPYLLVMEGIVMGGGVGRAGRRLLQPPTAMTFQSCCADKSFPALEACSTHHDRSVNALPTYESHTT